MEIVSKKKARSYSRDGVKSYLLASKISTHSSHLTTSLGEMEPGGIQKTHSHEQEQCYFIVNGNGEMSVGEETEIVRTGDCIFVPSNMSHGLKNVGAEVLSYFSAAAPSWGNDDLIKLWPDE